MNAIRIGPHTIGSRRPTFLVAEIGINHNGDLDLARAQIDAAADAGADAVKFQNYRTEDFIADRALTIRYQSQQRTVQEPQFDLFKRCELDEGALRVLAEHCRRRNIIFHSTPTSIAGLDQLTRLNAPVLKNGSDFLTNLPLIAAMGRTGLPTVLSTGMSTLSEIDAAVRTFRATGNTQLVLLLCTSAYPAPAHNVNLRKLRSLRAAFRCLVGFSDHTPTATAALGAVALGACWIEKHFTTDHNLPGPDHHFSADPDQFAELAGAVRELEANLGSAAIAPAACERDSRAAFRLSCTAATDLPAHQPLRAADLSLQRPGDGLPPDCAALLIGRPLRRPITAGTKLTLGDFE